MDYISLFSGIEAASVAWEPLGWNPAAFSEIEKFPSDVLKAHFPNIPNLGDITKIDWSSFGPVDLIVGGSPCQSFSYAGKREGLSGESRLMFEYIRAVRSVRPRYFLWENVPGALSSEDGGAFRQLLSEMDECGYGMAWRVLDAQFFGVPQRRQRVFLVGCLGDPRSAAEILFEPESLRWDFETSKEKRQAIAGNAETSTGEDCLNAWDNQSKRIFRPGGLAPTLSAGTSEGMNIVPSVAYGFSYKVSPGAGSIGYDREIVPSLLAGRNDAAINYSNDNGLVVRRLTPTECERLQGFPDGWTDIYENTPDTPRYKALGNSMAVPVMRWIGERIKKVDK